MSGLPRIAILDAAVDVGAPLAFPAGEAEVVLDTRLGDAEVASLAALAPDVVVLDMRGCGTRQATDAIRQVRSHWSSARIVVAGDAGDQAMAEAALAAGTSGYVSRDASPDALLKSVVAAVRGRVTLGKTATLAVLNLANLPKEKAKP